MRIYVGFDDTDTLDADRGTGKLARWYTEALPAGCTSWGVVRQQLLVHPDVPYTSHNSAACVVIDAADESVLPLLLELAVAHLERHMIEGSDPGLCLAAEDTPARARLEGFGARAAVQVVTQADALAAAASAHLSGHGGTNDGMIGAAAGVGLTMAGWSGRFIEFGDLRGFPTRVDVAALEGAGMLVAPVDRNVVAPKPTDIVDTQDWLRPRLWGGRPVVPVVSEGAGHWTAIARRAPDPTETVA
jgi:hypothetical protein